MCGSRGRCASWSLLGSVTLAVVDLHLPPRLRTCCRLHPVRRGQAQLPSASAGVASPGFSGASGFPPDHLITYLPTFNFPPPNDIVARSVAQSLRAPTAPTRSTGHARVPRGSVAAPVCLERRGRSNCPRRSRGRRLFRHGGVKLESPGVGVPRLASESAICDGSDRAREAHCCPACVSWGWIGPRWGKGGATAAKTSP